MESTKKAMNEAAITKRAKSTSAAMGSTKRAANTTAVAVTSTPSRP